MLSFILICLLLHKCFVWANIGFEIEFGMIAADSAHWKDLGEWFRQKPLGTSAKGLFEMQLDDFNEFFTPELLFPPTRLYKGLPDTGYMLEEDICPAFTEFGVYILNMKETLHTSLTGKVLIPIPNTSKTPKRLMFDISQLPELFSLAKLQATIGLRADQFMGFIGRTLSDEVFHELYSSYSEYIRHIHRNVQATSFSETCKCVLFFLSSYYVSGSDEVEGNLEYLKMIASIMSRTNLAQVFQHISEDDKRSLAAEGGDDEEPSTVLGKGLFHTILKVVNTVEVEFSSNNIVNSHFVSELGQDLYGPIGLEEYCISLAQGTDLFDQHDESMSKLDYSPEDEIVIEFREIPCFENEYDLLLTITDLFVWNLQFKQGFRGPFRYGEGDTLCGGILNTRPAPPKEVELSFKFKSSWIWTGEGDDANKFGRTGGHVTLGAGSGGFWEMSIDSNSIDFDIPSKRMYPMGIHIPHRFEEISLSLQQLADHFNRWELETLPEASSFPFHIPGVLPHSDLSLIAAKKEAASEIAGTLHIFTGLRIENAFQFITESFLSAPLLDILDEESKRILSHISSSQVSTIAQLFLFNLCSQVTSFSVMKMFTSQHPLNDIFFQLKESDIETFASMSQTPTKDLHSSAVQGMFHFLASELHDDPLPTSLFSKILSSPSNQDLTIFPITFKIDCNSGSQMIEFVNHFRSLNVIKGIQSTDTRIESNEGFLVETRSPFVSKKRERPDDTLQPTQGNRFPVNYLSPISER